MTARVILMIKAVNKHQNHYITRCFIIANSFDLVKRENIRKILFLITSCQQVPQIQLPQHELHCQGKRRQNKAPLPRPTKLPSICKQSRFWGSMPWNLQIH